MKINKLKLINFRNYSKLDISFGDNLNIFVGDNAQGKTNLLESIVMLALTKSHRVGNNPNIIMKNKDKCKIEGYISKRQVKSKLSVEFNIDGSKYIYINSTNIRKISDYISNLNVIIFTPVDIDIIKSSPNIRRNLLNVELSQLSRSYLNNYNEYNKILKIRNELLKKLNYDYNENDKIYFDIITDKLIEKSIPIYMQRYTYIEMINEEINDYFNSITGFNNLKVKYVTNLDVDNFDKKSIENNLRNLFKRNKNRELSYGSTLYGPHRDDLIFYLNDNDLKIYGSESQQKLAVMCFKLSEIDIFKNVTGYYPILLLDDIFGELDISKRNKLLKIINSVNSQSIITTTDLKNITHKYLELANIYNVNDGKIERS